MIRDLITHQLIWWVLIFNSTIIDNDEPEKNREKNTNKTEGRNFTSSLITSSSSTNDVSHVHNSHLTCTIDNLCRYCGGSSSR